MQCGSTASSMWIQQAHRSAAAGRVVEDPKKGESLPKKPRLTQAESLIGRLGKRGEDFGGAGAHTRREGNHVHIDAEGGLIREVSAA